jgi:predicted amidohydrolase YtcJ
MHNTWICPTLIIYSRKHEILNGRFEYHALYESLDSDLQSEWEHVVSNRQRKQLSDEEAVHGNKRYETQKKLVKAFYDHHIPLLLGSDFAGMPFVYPGYSLHEEMKLLSSIGIPNHDILQMATYHPAEFLGITESYGAVEVNKIADLIIFSANPIEHIENSTKIDAVLKSGRLVTHK